MNRHLTHEQLCDLLLAEPVPDSLESSGQIELLRAHLRDCLLCSGEFESLSQSLATFRSTADAWATRELANRPAALPLPASVPTQRTPALHAFMGPALWAAAAALVVAITLPLALHHDQPAAPKTPAPAAVTAQPRTSQSDEALLEEIDQTLSSPIPSPMQPLDDPTAGRHNQPDTQRKN
jgi:hypothetical protein